MDPALKNLREWIGLLFLLFLALDVAGVQYGMVLAHSSPLEPDAFLRRIAVMLSDLRGDSYNVYVMPQQLFAYYGLLTASGLALLAALTIIVGHGIHQLRVTRPRPSPKRRAGDTKAASESRRFPNS